MIGTAVGIRGLKDFQDWLTGRPSSGPNFQVGLRGWLRGTVSGAGQVDRKLGMGFLLTGWNVWNVRWCSEALIYRPASVALGTVWSGAWGGGSEALWICGVELPQDRSVLVAVTWGLVRKLLFSLFPSYSPLQNWRREGQQRRDVRRNQDFFFFFFSRLDGQVESAKGWRC